MFDPFSLIIQVVVGLAFSLASTLIKSIFQQDKKQKVAGVRGTIEKGGDVPLSFIMGFYATAGHLKYAGTWGHDGETPNAYMSQIITVSDLPVRGFAGWFVNGERVTLAGAQTGNLGFPVLEYRVGGKDHLWIKPFTGGQTVADPLLRNKFGSDPDRPFTADMIGRGVAGFVATALVNRELFSGYPRFLAEVNGVPLDDPRGLGMHDNPIVAIYTLMKGIRYDGQWVYGPQGITDADFDPANLHAQMDKCDTIRPGTSERRFRFGMEVSVDAEPHAIIGELLKACEGRIAEIGGTYKFLVGEPGAPVVAITDEDIVITQEQTYEPFPGFEGLFNGIGATYPEPQEAWENKEAPPRYRSDLEALDDNRRLPFTTEYKAVPFPLQVQELMRAAIEETRRFRKTVKTMRPNWWEFEPLDAYVWNSARHGFVNKGFLITVMDDLPNGNQVVADQEVDPTDYSWSSDYALPYDVTPLVIDRPAPQQITGFAVEPYVSVDSADRARRPGFRIFGYGAGLVDVREVWVQARLAGDADLVIDGRAPYDPGEAQPSARWSGDPLLRNTDYQVRGKLVPFSGRRTEWSVWLPVKTPDIGLSDLDLDMDAIRGEVLDSVADLDDWSRHNTREEIEKQRKAILLAAAGQAGDFTDRQLIRQKLTATSQSYRAQWQQDILVEAGPGSALVTRVEELTAAVNDPLTGLVANTEIVNLLSAQVNNPASGLEAVGNAILSLVSSVPGASAEGLLRLYTEAAPAGVLSRTVLSAAATAGSAAARAAMKIDVSIQGGVATSEILLVAGRISLVASDAEGAVKRGFLVVEGDNVFLDNARVRSLTSVNINVAELVASSAFLNNLVVGSAQIGTATIQTINMADGAVTVALSSSLPNGNLVTSGALVTAQTSVTFPTYQNGSISVSAQVNIPAQNLALSVQPISATVYLRRNGVIVRSKRVPGTAGGSAYTLGDGFVDISLIDIPPSPGSYSYELQFALSASSSANLAYQDFRLVGAYAKI